MDPRDVVIKALDQGDVDSLRKLARSSSGLCDSFCRSVAWPQLVGCNTEVSKTEFVPLELLPQHRDEPQVQKDIERSYINYPAGLSDPEQDELRQRLKRLIVRMLRQVPQLNYYQGYHDVCAVLTIVFGDDEQKAFRFLYHLTLGFLRDHMLQDIDPTSEQLALIPEIVQQADPDLYGIVGSNTPVYALSSVISLFSHDLNRFEDLCLVWDTIFAQNDPALPLYIYASLMCRYKDTIVKDLQNADADENPNEYSEFVHVILSRLINKKLNVASPTDARNELTAILSQAVILRKAFPPSSLASYKQISRHSCLKKTSPSERQLSLQCHEEKRRVRQKEKDEKKRERHKAREERRKANRARFSTASKAGMAAVAAAPTIMKVSVGVGLLTVMVGVAMDPESQTRLSSGTHRMAQGFYNSMFNR